MKITTALMAEHVVYHSLFDHIEKSLPHLKTLAEVRVLASALEALLKVHSEVEDKLLIEPLEPAFAQMGQAENFHQEHEEIDRDLYSLLTVRQLGRAKKMLLKAVLMSRKHFDKEERLVFPLAEQHLSVASLRLLGKKWLERRK